MKSLGPRLGAASDGVRARSHAHRQAVRDVSDEKLRERATEQLDHKYADYHERVARFILTDPLRPLRARLAERIEQIERSGPQRDLFAAS